MDPRIRIVDRASYERGLAPDRVRDRCDIRASADMNPVVTLQYALAADIHEGDLSELKQPGRLVAEARKVFANVSAAEDGSLFEVPLRESSN